MFRIFSAGEKTAWKLKCHQKVTFQKSVWKICWVTSCLGVVVGDYSFMRHDLAAAAATKLFQLVMYCIFLVYAFHEKSYKKEAINNSFFTLYLYWPKDSHLLNRVHDFKKNHVWLVIPRLWYHPNTAYLKYRHTYVTATENVAANVDFILLGKIEQGRLSPNMVLYLRLVSTRIVSLLSFENIFNVTLSRGSSSSRNMKDSL